MCRPIGDTEALLIVGLGEARLKRCEMLLQGADRSSESPGHLRLLVILAATLGVTSGAPGEARAWPQVTQGQPFLKSFLLTHETQRPSVLCTEY